MGCGAVINDVYTQVNGGKFLKKKCLGSLQRPNIFKYKSSSYHDITNSLVNESEVLAGENTRKSKIHNQKAWKEIKV